MFSVCASSNVNNVKFNIFNYIESCHKPQRRGWWQFLLMLTLSALSCVSSTANALHTCFFVHRVASIQSTQRYECVYVLKMNKNTRTRLRIQCDPLIVHIFFVVDGSSFSILFCAIHSVSMHCKNAFCASFLEKNVKHFLKNYSAKTEILFWYRNSYRIYEFSIRHWKKSLEIHFYMENVRNLVDLLYHKIECSFSTSTELSLLQA